MAHIIMIDPKDGTKTIHELKKRLTKIGRLSDNDMILADDKISRYHAQIIRQSDQDYLILDLNSAGGTRVNGKKISNKKLKDGDSVDIGPFTLSFKTADVANNGVEGPEPAAPLDRTIPLGANVENHPAYFDRKTAPGVNRDLGEQAQGETAKTVVLRIPKSTRPDPTNGTKELDSRVELLSKKIKAKLAEPGTHLKESSVSPPSKFKKGPKTVKIPPSKLVNRVEDEKKVEPRTGDVVPFKAPGYRTRPTNLLHLLFRNDVISEDELNQFLREVQETAATPYEVIARKSLYYRRGGMDTLSGYFKLPFIESDDELVKRHQKSSIPESMARRCLALPIKEEDRIAGEYLPVIMADPTDLQAIDDLTLAAKKPVKPVCFSTPEIIKKAISRVFKTTFSTTALDLANIKLQLGNKDITVEDMTGFPIVDMVNYLINKALSERASDIHFEPTEHFLIVRYRIDGVLHETAALPHYLHPEIVSRIKIICEMNVAEKRLPQDGRFSITVGEKKVDVRVSTYPTVHGEKVVLRLLEQEAVITDINRLGMEENEVALLAEKITAPYGMVLLTGPTGCGKTTTLYACLSMINSQDINILTVEDPVEYKIPGVYQMQANEKIGLTFATGLRTMLRHDPDVIMVGEIRDHETAEIAIRAAITGHIVFSTLHTNDAVGIVLRLTDMGIEPFLVSSSLSLAIAQRLCRTICEDCRIYVEPKIILDRLKEEGINESRLRKLGLDISRDREYSIGKGCPKCRGTGYFGRRAIFEIFNITQEAKDLIISKDFRESELKKLAIEQGMVTLLQAGRRAIDRGITTVEEIIRVCGEG